MTDDLRNFGFLPQAPDTPFKNGPSWNPAAPMHPPNSNRVGLSFGLNPAQFSFPQPQFSSSQNAQYPSSSPHASMAPVRPAAPSDSQKNRQFHVQQDKLKHMSLPKGSKKMLTPDDLINTMLEATVPKNGKKPSPKLTPSEHHQPAFTPSSSNYCIDPDDFGDFGDFVAASDPIQIGPVAAHSVTSNVMLSQLPSNTPAESPAFGVGEMNGFQPLRPSQQPLSILSAILQNRAPAWLTNLDLAPAVYRELAAQVCSSPSPGILQPDPQKAFEIFASSGLPGPVLSQIWSIVHPQGIDSFEMPEFIAVLVLIAVFQQRGSAVPIEMILNLPVPPVPLLSSGIATAPSMEPKVQEEPPSPEFKIDFGFSPPVFEKVKFLSRNEDPAVDAKVEDDDDFGDFQSVTTSRQNPPSPPSLISENDDKYAALRSLTFDETPLSPVSTVEELSVVENVAVEKPTVGPIPIQPASARSDTPDSIPSLPEILSLDKLPPPIPVVISGEESVDIVKNFVPFSSAVVAKKAVKIEPVSAQTDDFGDFVAAFGDSSEASKEETRSVASLDFVSSISNPTISNEGEGDSFWIVNPLDDQNKSTVEPSASAEQPVNVSSNDKYSAFRDLTEEFGGVTEKSKAVLTEFERIWNCGTDVFRAALELMNHAAKDGCVEEFLAVQEVGEFIFCVFEVFAVGVRCCAAFRENFGESAMEEGRNSWETFSGAFRGFLDAVRQSGRKSSGILVADTLEAMATDSFSPEAPSTARCGVCLSSVVPKSTTDSSTDPLAATLASSPLSRHGDEFRSNAQTLQWGVSRYHVSCANLWLNRVQSVLPALTL